MVNCLNNLHEIYYKENVLIYLYLKDNNIEMKESYEQIDYNYVNSAKIVSSFGNNYTDNMLNLYYNLYRVCVSYGLKILSEIIIRRVNIIKFMNTNSGLDMKTMMESLYNRYIKNDEKNVLCQQLTLYSIVMFKYFVYNTDLFCHDIDRNPFKFLHELYELNRNNPNDKNINKFVAMFAMAVYESYDINYFYYFCGVYTEDSSADVGYYTFKIMFKYYVDADNVLSAKARNEGLLDIKSDINKQYKFFKENQQSNPYTVYTEMAWKMYYNKTIKQQIVVKHNGITMPIIDNNEDLTDYGVVLHKVKIKFGKYSFNIGKLYKKYYKDGKANDLFLYKTMPADTTDVSFSKYREPTWFSDYKTVNIYIEKPVAKKEKKQSVFSFSLYNNIKLFIIDEENLNTFKRAFGNIKVWMLGYNQYDWHELVKTCMKFGVIDRKLTNDIIKRNLSLEIIINFIFFNNKATPGKIVRRSVYLLDKVWIKGLCICLNNGINYYLNNPNNTDKVIYDKLRIDGYYAPMVKNYKIEGSYFHPEIALCTPYVNLERRIDNKFDFAYFLKSKNMWCSVGQSVVGGETGEIECVLTGNYNKYNKTYLKYWKIIEDWATKSTSEKIPNPVEVKYQIDQWKSFSVNIEIFNSLKVCSKCDTTKNLIDFVNIFLKRLFYHISQNPYKLIQQPYVSKDGKISWRPNHGSIHHMRTVYLSIIIYKILKSRNTLMFVNYFPTKRHIITAVFASVFVSIARIDEDKKDGTKGLKLVFSNKLWSEIFPILGRNDKIINIIKNMKMTYSLTQLSSCFMFMSLMKTLLLPDDEEFVEILGFSNIFYAPDNPSNLSKILNTEYTSRDESDIIYKISILHGLTMAPHYLEHCRGSYSDGLYRNFVYGSLYKAGATKEDLAVIMYVVIDNIIKTGEKLSWNKKSKIKMDDVKKLCLYEKDELNGILDRNQMPQKFKLCCMLFNKETYGSKFAKLSNNFEDVWNLLNIGDNIAELLSPCDKKIYFYDDNKNNFFDSTVNYPIDCKQVITKHVKYGKFDAIKWLEFLNSSSTLTGFYGILVFISNNFTVTYKYNSGLSENKINDGILSIKRDLVGGFVLGLDYTLSLDVIMAIDTKNLINSHFKEQDKWDSVKPQLLKLCEENGLHQIKNTISQFQLSESYLSTIFINIDIGIVCEYYFGGKNRINMLRQMFSYGVPVLLLTENVISKDPQRLPNLSLMLKYIGLDSPDIRYAPTGHKIRVLKELNIC